MTMRQQLIIAGEISLQGMKMFIDYSDLLMMYISAYNNIDILVTFRQINDNSIF